MSDMIEAVARHLKAQQKALEGLIESLQGALANVTSGIERGADASETMEKSLGIVETALVDVAQAIEGNGIAEAIDRAAQALAKLQMVVNVPQQAPPTITVNVPEQAPPTFTVEAVMPQQEPPVVNVNVPAGRQPVAFEVRIKKPYGAETVMTITPKY